MSDPAVPPVFYYPLKQTDTKASISQIQVFSLLGGRIGNRIF